MTLRQQPIYRLAAEGLPIDGLMGSASVYPLPSARGEFLVVLDVALLVVPVEESLVVGFRNLVIPVLVGVVEAFDCSLEGL